MRQHRILAATGICALLCSAMAFAAPLPLVECYEENGNQYIKKTYIIGKEEEILDVADMSFELDGLIYHQIDITNEPVVEVRTKKVEQTETTAVSSQNHGAVLEKLGETKKYVDEEGYCGTLEPDMSSISYRILGYTTKTETKNGSRMYYGLPSMDTSQIPKGIWDGGVYLNLINVKWIGDNHFASADTAVGNTYAAAGYYRGTYDVKIPSGYSATVLYKGVAEKEISEQTAYTITYLGEETIPRTEGNPSFGLMLGGVVVALVFIGSGIYLFIRYKRKSESGMAEENEELEQEETEDENI